MGTENTPGRRREDYVRELCVNTHKDLDRRVAKVEASYENDIKRLYDKLESETLAWASKAVETAKRPSIQMLLTVTFLSSTTTGLLVLILTHLLGGK